MEKRHSKLGIASFVISIAVGCLLFALFVVAGILNEGRIQNGQEYPGQLLVGLGLIGLLGVDAVAVTLGIAALFQSGTKRLFGILGLTFSSLTILGAGGLIIIGLLYSGRFAR